MNLKFTKMEGLGNDYIYINCIDNEYEHIAKNSNFQEMVKKLCNRNFGIGSDGVILIMKSEIADFKMRMFNSDGTEGKMCGNGIRCVGKFVYDKNETKKTELNIETLSGIKKLKLSLGEDNKVTEVKVDMGEPKFTPSEIPVINDTNKVKIKIEDKEMQLMCVSMGNPHAVILVDDVEYIDIEKYGPIIENYIIFPERTNVEFVEITNKDNIKLRVWERGAKETLACGTGACASAVICNMEGYINDEVNVHLLGGTLHIKWDKGNNHVYMQGPAKTVFEGEIDYGKY